MTDPNSRDRTGRRIVTLGRTLAIVGIVAAAAAVGALVLALVLA